jgi:glutamate transport system substrate-binding protein
MKVQKATAAAAVPVCLALALSACGSGPKSDAAGHARTLTVGIKFDQPGLGLKKPDGSYTGFDVDVARYVGRQLGYADKDIRFKETPSADRENAISRGDVDFVVASYSITDERRQRVDFAGPYLLAHQDLLIRTDERITKGTDLNGKKLCSVTGSTSAQNVKDALAPKAQLRQYGTYSECLDGLTGGAVDAVTTDDAILAGYAAQAPYRGKVRLAGLQLSNENYGIGLKKGDTALRNRINAALRRMEKDGTWEKDVKASFGPAGYHYEPAPAIGRVAG